MEMVKVNGFVELSANDLETIDGGAWKWYDYVLNACIPGYGLGKIIYEDLRNCYENGYAEGKALNK